MFDCIASDIFSSTLRMWAHQPFFFFFFFSLFFYFYSVMSKRQGNLVYTEELCLDICIEMELRLIGHTINTEVYTFDLLFLILLTIYAESSTFTMCLHTFENRFPREG